MFFGDAETVLSILFINLILNHLKNWICTQQTLFGTHLHLNGTDEGGYKNPINEIHCVKCWIHWNFISPFVYLPDASLSCSIKPPVKSKSVTELGSLKVNKLNWSFSTQKEYFHKFEKESL